MKKHVFGAIALAGAIVCSGLNVYPQGETKKPATPTGGNGAAAPAVAITPTTSPIDLMRAAIAAQGGEKFKNVKSMVLKGSVDLYAPNSTQSIPGGFLIVVAGEKARIEVDARPAVSFKMIYDGQQSYSSLPGVSMPPMTRFGMSMLAKFDQGGFTIGPLPDKKKQRSFRITDSDGNVTDFYIDSTTGRVMSFLIPFGSYTFGTENKKFKDFDGVLVATSFTQRMEMPQGAFFADYNVKEVKLNQPIEDEVFAIPN